jgi:hypothetical protein
LSMTASEVIECRLCRYYRWITSCN